MKGATIVTLHEKCTRCWSWHLTVRTFANRSGPFDFEKSGVGESHNRSQQRRIHFLAPAAQLCDPSCDIYDVMVESCSSTTLKRVRCATLQAETQALLYGQEAGDRIRAVLAEIYGFGSQGTVWDTLARNKVPHVSITDWRSFADHLNCDAPARVQDKRQ